MTNPTLEQVEAARAEYDRSEDMCAALVAAAGVTPQEPGAAKASYISPSLPGMIRNLWKSDPSENSVRTALKLAGDLIQELIDIRAAPVQVDEAKLAEVLLDHAMDFEQQPRPAGPKGSGYACECGLEILEPRTGPGVGWRHRKHLAHVVAEWLRGGGQ